MLINNYLYNQNSYLRFNSQFRTSIQNKEKTVTARYDFDRQLTPGTLITCLDDEDNHFALAEVTRVTQFTVEAFATADLDGHQSYDSVEDCINNLMDYYPDAEITPETRLTVIWFEVVDDHSLTTLQRIKPLLKTILSSS